MEDFATDDLLWEKILLGEHGHGSADFSFELGNFLHRGEKRKTFKVFRVGENVSVNSVVEFGREICGVSRNDSIGARNFDFKIEKITQLDQTVDVFPPVEKKI